MKLLPNHPPEPMVLADGHHGGRKPSAKTAVQLFMLTPIKKILLVLLLCVAARS